MTFCVNGQNFEPEQYYRDDDQARELLSTVCENPVLLTGLRKIGKSWFLRRFKQIFEARATRHFAEDGMPSTRPLESWMPAELALLDGGSPDFEDELQAVLARADRTLLLAIDELEKLVADPARAHLLDRLLSYRPLIFAASPAIREPLPAHALKLATFFTDGCVHAVLRPLSGKERMALLLQTCDPDQGVPLDKYGLAAAREWGGHPVVLQQVGVEIRNKPKIKYPDLLNLVHAGLNSGPRYGYSLCEAGLTRDQRGALGRIAAGSPPPSTDHAAIELQSHGAILSHAKKTWAIENKVLARYLQNAAPARIEPGSPPPKASLPAPPLAAAFQWIHLSDIHFGAGAQKHRFDQKVVMRAISADIEAHAPKPVDRIFVTGDIAFSAKPAEYGEARAWFEDVTQAAGIPLDRLRLVPGNHDVDRALTKKLLASHAHEKVRSGFDLDELLSDASSRGVLAAKLASYQSFLAGSFPGHPPAVENQLDWCEPIPEAPGIRGPIRVAGLSTVWISDEHDGNGENPFVPNMALGMGPLEHTIRTTTSAELLFVLTHHPPEWLHDTGAKSLENALARRSHVHLCGHVHAAKGSALKRFGHSGTSVRCVAGAAHGDASEAGKHGYSWGALRYHPAKASWQIGWAPRIYVQGLDKVRADATNHELDQEGFVWENFACPWPAPQVISAAL